MRRDERFVDPSIQVWCNLSHADLCARLAIGHRAHVDRGSTIWLADLKASPGRIDIGDRCYVGPYCFLGSCHSLSIGPDTMIGAGSYVITVNHRTDRRDVPYSQQGFTGADVKLGSNVWLGCHVVVLPGVSIGDGAIVGAGGIVTKDIPAGETWAGVPARRIRSVS